AYLLSAPLSIAPVSSRRRPLPDRHPFPTRRSSDLGSQVDRDRFGDGLEVLLDESRAVRVEFVGHELPSPVVGEETGKERRTRLRSEEHTSELQSRFDLVCRLLLDKKNSPPFLRSAA